MESNTERKNRDQGGDSGLGVNNDNLNVTGISEVSREASFKVSAINSTLSQESSFQSVNIRTFFKSHFIILNHSHSL